MTTKQDVEFHQGETWQINLSAHNVDGSPMALDADTDVQFRISGDAGTLLTLVRDAGVTVVDSMGGLALIVVTVDDQTANGVTEADTYLYEIRVITDEFVSIQAAGKFRVKTSLFAVS